MLTIGENINATNKAVGQAIIQKDRAYLEELARSQAAAGADYVDVNAGTGGASPEQQVADMEWLVDLVQVATEKPLVIDSDDQRVIEAALSRCSREGTILNSVNAEDDRLNSIGRLAVEYGTSVVALAMGSGGIPGTAEERLAACEYIMGKLEVMGLKPEQVFFDPLVLPISVDSNQGMVTIHTLEEIKKRFPDTRTVMGLSNISYGLAQRKVVNRSFMLMAACAGLDAVILDPLDDKMMGLVKVADMLTGNDPNCRTYLRAHRKGLIID